jgi:hypothetical protein
MAANPTLIGATDVCNAQTSNSGQSPPGRLVGVKARFLSPTRSQLGDVVRRASHSPSPYKLRCLEVIGSTAPVMGTPSMGLQAANGCSIAGRVAPAIDVDRDTAIPTQTRSSSPAGSHEASNSMSPMRLCTASSAPALARICQQCPLSQRPKVSQQRPCRRLPMITPNFQIGRGIREAAARAEHSCMNADWPCVCVPVSDVVDR